MLENNNLGADFVSKTVRCIYRLSCVTCSRLRRKIGEFNVKDGKLQDEQHVFIFLISIQCLVGCSKALADNKDTKTLHKQIAPTGRAVQWTFKTLLNDI